MKILLIRHGKTVGNLKKCFNGVTDDDLCDEGIALLKKYVDSNVYTNVEAVVSSPMKRCLQTSKIVFPNHKPIVVEELREINFGVFENKNHRQLENNTDYINWIDSNGLMDIPKGEPLKDFENRCKLGFEKALALVGNVDTLALVIHGGTIMSLLTALTGENYFTAMPQNGLGFVVEWNGKIEGIEKLE